MTIIGLQRRLVEVGRIRMGEKAEGGRPVRLETWKLTSRDQVRLKAAANAFGGEVREWKDHPGQYELHTTVDALPILLMPGQAISQWYELWSGGGCKRRCDGENEQITDGACLCDPEARECKPHTRLNVLLPDVAGVGAWRLDTSGYYAATELTGTVDLLEIATSRGVLLPARLRIDQRSILRDGQTRRFPVPTLDIDIRPLEMHAITQSAVEGQVAIQGDMTEIPKGYTPLPAITQGGVSVSEGLAGAAAGVAPSPTNARSAAPMGDQQDIDAVVELEDIPLPVDGDDPPADTGVATSDQQKLIMIAAREHEWKDADRYDLTELLCGEGIRSVKRVPKDKVDALIAALKNKDASAGEPTNEQVIGELRALGDALSIRQQVDAALSQHTDDREWLVRQVARLRERYADQQAAS